MAISRRKFLTGLTALVATPAVIRYSGVMAVNAAQATPFATVSGLDLSGKMVLHKFWDPISANQFAGTSEFHNMAAVHWWNYAKPQQSLNTPSFIDDRTVEKIIADRILKQEQQRKAWLDDPAWTIYGTIGPDTCVTTQFDEAGPIRKPWEML